MNIYGIARASIFTSLGEQKCWEIMKIVREGDKLIWTGILQEELEKNGWSVTWHNLYDTDISLKEFQEIFNFPYVGEVIYDIRSSNKVSAHLDVDPAHFYSSEGATP